MKTLRSISTAVLLCLILAAPAAADELSLSASSVFPGEAVSYTVKVDESHPDIRPGVVAIVRLVSDSECLVESNKEQHILEELPYSTSTTETHVMEVNLYEAFATYHVCEYYLVKEVGEPRASAQKLTSFAVVARPVPPVTPPTPVVATEAPLSAVASSSAVAPTIVTPPTPVVATHVTILTAAEKLRVALVKCKKQKNKKKRVKCERAAKKAAHHR